MKRFPLGREQNTHFAPAEANTPRIAGLKLPRFLPGNGINPYKWGGGAEKTEERMLQKGSPGERGFVAGLIRRAHPPLCEAV